jgi:2-hydroxyglutarate dehydrogenase
VIHAGIYYTPGSMKAKLCVEGLHATYKYCNEYSLPYKKVGKLIVAVDEEQNKRLDTLFEKGLKNNVPDLKLINSEEIKKIEPNCVGIRAIHSPNTGIIDWGMMAKHYGKVYQDNGGHIKLNFEVEKFLDNSDPDFPLKITSTNNSSEINVKYSIVCGGLQSDRLAKKAGCDEYPKIVPFRGDYLVLKPNKSSMVNGNIYPVPNPDFPFLGVHFTPRMDGSVWLGPNAVLSFKREGYKITDFSLKDAVEEIGFRGLRKLAYKNLSYGLKEMYRGVSISATVKELQKFVPSLKVCDVVRYRLFFLFLFFF